MAKLKELVNPGVNNPLGVVPGSKLPYGNEGEVGPSGRPAAPLKVHPTYVEVGEVPRIIQQHERAIPGSPERRWKVWGMTPQRAIAPLYVLAVGEDDARAVFVNEHDLANALADVVIHARVMPD